MQNAWKCYLEWLPLPTYYYTETQLKEKIPDLKNIQEPCILLKHSVNQFEEVIKSSELINIDLNQLSQLINQRVVSCRIKPNNV